jgi:hypothetical protein
MRRTSYSDMQPPRRLAAVWDGLESPCPGVPDAATPSASTTVGVWTGLVARLKAAPRPESSTPTKPTPFVYGIRIGGRRAAPCRIISGCYHAEFALGTDATSPW